MNFKCVVFQTHIPQYDVQGGIPSADRKKIINLSIKYFKKNNPQTYIILSGHGETPLKETIDFSALDFTDFASTNAFDLMTCNIDAVHNSFNSSGQLYSFILYSDEFSTKVIEYNFTPDQGVNYVEMPRIVDTNLIESE